MLSGATVDPVLRCRLWRAIYLLCHASWLDRAEVSTAVEEVVCKWVVYVQSSCSAAYVRRANLLIDFLNHKEVRAIQDGSAVLTRELEDTLGIRRLPRQDCEPFFHPKRNNGITMQHRRNAMRRMTARFGYDCSLPAEKWLFVYSYSHESYEAALKAAELWAQQPGHTPVPSPWFVNKDVTQALVNAFEARLPANKKRKTMEEQLFGPDSDDEVTSAAAAASNGEDVQFAGVKTWEERDRELRAKAVDLTKD